jgi:uncharacterized protein YdhG (YjbR/CyaY superfamily)
MGDNKTKPTNTKVDDFLSKIDPKRQEETKSIIEIMQKISGFNPVLWGPSIIGFGSQHYKYETGREGDMPVISFSPRKASISIYFAEGFDRYSDLLSKIGKYKASVSCLYINKLEDVNMEVLREMIKQSFERASGPADKIATVEEYISRVPKASRKHFDELRSLVVNELPNAKEVFSYGIIGYKIDDKRARVFVSGWKDHVAMYPIPKDEALRLELKPYIKGKGTLWFPLDKPLPKELIKKCIVALVK